MHLIWGYQQRIENGFVVLTHPITGKEVRLRREDSLVLPYVNAAQSVEAVVERAREGGTDLQEQHVNALLIRLRGSGFLRLEGQQTLLPEVPAGQEPLHRAEHEAGHASMLFRLGHEERQPLAHSPMQGRLERPPRRVAATLRSR